MINIHSPTETPRHLAVDLRPILKWPVNSIATVAGAVAAFLLASCATSKPLGKSVPLSDAAEARASLRSTDRLMVYEGLPHQARERELMEREAARSDVTTIAGYHFYTPSRPAKRPDDLRRVLGESLSYGNYSGPKTCGGFHPDYAVTWNSGGQDRYILICYGCGEAIISDNSGWLPYDLKDQALHQVQSALAGHAAKRPSAAP